VKSGAEDQRQFHPPNPGSAGLMPVGQLEVAQRPWSNSMPHLLLENIVNAEVPFFADLF
jgi:hypothetical protein